MSHEYPDILRIVRSQFPNSVRYEAALRDAEEHYEVRFAPSRPGC